MDAEVLPKIVPPLPRPNLKALDLPRRTALDWLRAGWRDFWTDPAPSLLYGFVVFAVSVVIVTMISMYLLGLGLMGQRQVDTMKDYWYDRVQVTVLLCAEKTRYANCAGQPTTDVQRAAVEQQLEDLKPTVKEVFYETREEAFTRFKQTYKNSPLARAGESYFADSYRAYLDIRGASTDDPLVAEARRRAAK